MSDPLHTVVETAAFTRAASIAGLDRETLALIVDVLAANPLLGDVIEGTGGVRKARFARPGGGKSGGVRTIHFYGGEDMPVFLLTVYAKGQKANLSKAEKNVIKAAVKVLKESYDS